MFETLTVFRIAGALAGHSAARQAEISRNVANSDTPGFRARDLEPFSEWMRDGPELPLRSDPSRHLAFQPDPAWRRAEAPDGMSPNGNTVSVEEQILKAAEVRQSHDLSLTVYGAALSLLRTSIGGRG